MQKCLCSSHSKIAVVFIFPREGQRRRPARELYRNWGRLASTSVNAKFNYTVKYTIYSIECMCVYIWFICVLSLFVAVAWQIFHYRQTADAFILPVGLCASGNTLYMINKQPDKWMESSIAQLLKVRSRFRQNSIQLWNCSTRHGLSLTFDALWWSKKSTTATTTICAKQQQLRICRESQFISMLLLDVGWAKFLINLNLASAFYYYYIADSLQRGYLFIWFLYLFTVQYYLKLYK